MNIFAWEEVSTTYILFFLAIVAGFIGIFYLGTALPAWQARRRAEREILEIEKRRGLTEKESDLVVHVCNQHELLVPTTFYTSLRVFDTLVGQEIEMLLSSSAPWRLKRSTMALTYSARAKLFPETVKDPMILVNQQEHPLQQKEV